MLYLASQSARRKEILTKLKVHFRVVPSSYKEEPQKKLSPRELVLVHAIGKATEAEIPKQGEWVLGADTVVVLGKAVLGKPRSKVKARRMLEALSGRMNRVLTGVCFLNHKTKQVYTDISETKVYMKKLSGKRMEEYHQAIHPFDKAGSYAIQEGPKIVRSYKGSYTNIVGLPTEMVKKYLKKIGVSG